MDRFQSQSSSVTSPARNAADLVPGGAIPHVTRAVYVGTAGDIAVTMADGDDALFRNVLGGTILPIRIREIRAQGTTADDIVGLW